MIKLQDFKRKVFAIGVYDDPLKQMVPQDKPISDLRLISKDFKEESEEHEEFKKKVIYNVRLIRDVMRDLRPNALVLEMCDERFDRWLADVIAHPSYDNTM
jgi:hypothetical protein